MEIEGPSRDSARKRNPAMDVHRTFSPKSALKYVEIMSNLDVKMCFSLLKI